jgi:CheY-like chemotaxis protein
MQHRDEPTSKSALSFEGLAPENTGVRLTALDAERQGIVALSERTGAPGVDVRTLPLDPADLGGVPRELAMQYLALPLLVRDDTLLVALADPSSTEALRALEFVTGRRVYAYAADAEALRAVIERVYELRAEGAGGEPVDPLADPPPGTRPSSPQLFSQGGTPPVVPGATAPTRRTRMGTLLHPSPPPASAAVSRSVPLAPEVVSRPSSPPRPAVVAQPSRVCLALVDARIVDALREGMATMGFAVEVEGSVREALLRAASQPPEMLIVDLDLPGPHGFEVLRQVRAQPALVKVPVLVTSAAGLGWRRERDLAEVFNVGAVLQQPFTPADVVLKAGRCLSPGSVPEEALPPDAEQALRWSNEAWVRGDYPVAVGHLERASAAASDSFRLHYHLGLALGRIGEVFRAIDALERSVALYDGYFPSLKNLAVLYEKAGFRHAALESWERAYRCAPDDATREQIKGRVIALLA